MQPPVLKKRDAYAGRMADAVASQAEQAVAGALGRGVLHQQKAASRFGLTRCPPSAALAPFVDFHWILRWDLRGQAPHEQTILPHPNVNLAFERTGATIYGVEERLFSRRLEGRGTVLGVRFRAGGFRPFWDGPVAGLNNRTVPASRLFGPTADEARRAILAAPDDAAMVARAERLLRSVLPPRDPVAEQVAAMVTRITGDSSLRRVGELAAALGLPVRQASAAVRRVRWRQPEVGDAPGAAAGGGDARRAGRSGRLGGARVRPRLCRSGAPHARLHGHDRCPASPLCHIRHNSTAYV